MKRRKQQLERCRNCDTPLRGEYCAHCGQREGRGDVQLREVAGDLADDFFHWDSRIWRTLLPLLLRPGFLTTEFIAGRKARYVPALRLYLMISFVQFLVLSLNSGPIGIGASVIVDEAGETPAATARQSASGAGDDLPITFDGQPRRAQDVEPDSNGGDAVIAPFVIAGENSVTLEQGISIDLADEDSPQWLQDLELCRWRYRALSGGQYILKFALVAGSRIRENAPGLLSGENSHRPAKQFYSFNEQQALISPMKSDRRLIWRGRPQPSRLVNT